MIDAKELKALVKLMVENDLTEIDLKDAKGEQVAIKRAGPPPIVQAIAASPMAAPPPVPGVPSPASATVPTPTPVPPTPAAEDAGLVPVKSPMVGSFYASPSPEAKAFVSVGDRVGPDTVVCIIEAMKVFNEIKAEVSGVIAKVLVENGNAVEFGQPLFLVRPA